MARAKVWTSKNLCLVNPRFDRMLFGGDDLPVVD